MAPALLVGAALLLIGFYGIVTRRNLLLILINLELMLNGVNITLMTFSRFHAGTSELQIQNVASVQFLVMLIFAVAACEAAVGLSILVTLFRQHHSVDADRLFDIQKS